MWTRSEYIDEGCVDSASFGFFTGFETENSDQTRILLTDLPPGDYSICTRTAVVRACGPSELLLIRDGVEIPSEYEFHGFLPITGSLWLTDPAFHLPGRHDERTGPPRRQMIFDFRPWDDDRSNDPVDDNLIEIFVKLDQMIQSRNYHIVETDDLYRRVEIPEVDIPEVTTMLDGFDPVFQDDHDLPLWNNSGDGQLFSWVEKDVELFGFSTVSGFGDGGYPIYKLFDGDRFVGLRVVFIES